MDSLIIRVAAVGIAAALLAVTIKRDNPAFAVLISFAGGLLILFMVVPQLSAVLELIRGVADGISGVDGGAYVALVIRIIGIAYISEFGAAVCADAGETGIAQKIELAGKVLILAASAPAVLTLLRQTLSLLG